MNKLKLLDLFSGIGGFSLGLESTGYFETIGFVEKDEFCQKVLQKNFKDIPIEEDIRNVKGNKYAANIITGGFPCQPFSVAGKQKGTADDRYLWDEMLRVIKETKPRWVVGENVEGIININNGLVLRQVQDDLENEGFQVQCLVIPASGIGAWHQRKRVWIIAHSDSNRNSNEITGSNGEEKEIQRKYREKNNTSWKSFGTNTNDVPNSSSQRSSSQSIGVNRELEKEIKRKKETRNKSTLRTSSSCSDVPNTNIKGLERHRDEYELREVKQEKNFIRSSNDGTQKNVRNSKSTGLQSSTNRQRKREFWRTGTPREQCQETWWQTQSRICGVPDGLSLELHKDRNNRIKALGNSIVPQIAREIGLAIMKAELDG